MSNCSFLWSTSLESLLPLWASRYKDHVPTSSAWEIVTAASDPQSPHRPPTAPLALPFPRVNSRDENRVSATLPTGDPVQNRLGNQRWWCYTHLHCSSGLTGRAVSCSGKLVRLSLWTGRSPACRDIPRDRNPEDIPREDTRGDDPLGASAGGAALSPHTALDNPTCHRQGQARQNTHEHNQINTITVPGSRYQRSAGTCERA